MKNNKAKEKKFTKKQIDRKVSRIVDNLTHAVINGIRAEVTINYDYLEYLKEKYKFR